MTYDKLLGMSSKQWEEISDAELYKLLEPLFVVTRPDRIVKPPGHEAIVKEKKRNTSFESLQKELLKQATLAGILIPKR